MSIMQWTLDLVERGWIPDPIVQRGIRRLLEDRIREIGSDPDATTALAEQMRRSPLAIEADAANEQHYELPPEFFSIVLGRHLKYSCCYWPNDTDSLDDAEAEALRLTVDRAEIEDGMEVLELGCGWGSLSLWMAERFPRCRITAVSNSAPQCEFIRSRAAARGLSNVEVETADMNHFRCQKTYDRIVSIEMFEHMRNYATLLERVSGWLSPHAKLFVHIFCHRSTPYFYEDRGPSDWMARHFFSGGLMPSEHLLDEFAGPVRLDRRWRVDGTHYERTALAWLANMDRSKSEILKIFESVYGSGAERWFRRWRLFFLACTELFGYNDGTEWFVSHSLWSPGEPSVH